MGFDPSCPLHGPVAALPTKAKVRAKIEDDAKWARAMVMMHSTLGVENAIGQQGWLHVVVDFAKPFRMPDFFLISGLFLNRVIDRDWLSYFDRKVVHFAYFYVLWTALQFAIKAPVFAQEYGAQHTLWLYIESFWEPFGTLWFIYLLPVFFVVTKLARQLQIPPLIIWLAGAALESLHLASGHTVLDEFASRFAYFYTGYLFAPAIFRLAKAVALQPEAALAGLVTWSLLNGILVFNGIAQWPIVSLMLGLAGAGAVVSVSALLAKTDVARPLCYCGRNSIVIYLAFFLPMVLSRTVLLKTGCIDDAGTMSVIVTTSGVIGSLLAFWLVRGTFFGFLFERPRRFWITARKPLLLQPAE